MKKIRNLIIVLVLLCTISSVSYAKNDFLGSGTAEDPYQLTLGQGIIDVYYAEGKEGEPEKWQNFYFEFTNGSVNAANYLVEHNADKQRVRFTMQGNSEADLRVTSKEGIKYLQAGAINYMPSGDDFKIQIPYYTITADEMVSIKTTEKKNVHGTMIDVEKIEKYTNSVDLGNGYINVNNTLAANVSNYSTSYVFSKSNLNYDVAYNITDEQIEKKVEFGDYVLKTKNTIFVDGKQKGSTGDKTYNLSGQPVKIIYQFNGTNSELNTSPGEHDASGLEELLSKIFISIGDMAVNITELGGKKETPNASGDYERTMYVTIDSLVFNEYPKTIVDLWGDTGSTNVYTKRVVNFWYKIFQAWAILLYVIILVYIGIKTVLYTGTPEQKKIKPMIEGWLLGVLMLFCLPYLFKYMIEINDVFVDILRVNSKHSVYAYYTFEDVYKDLGLGDKEDGEDSTTDIVVRLQNAKKDLLDKIEEIENELDAFNDEYQESINEAKKYEENYEQAKAAAEERLNSIEKNYYDMGYLFQKDGVIIDHEQMSKEMWDLVDKYYAENEYFDGDDFSDEFDDGLEDLADEYASHFIVYDPETGAEAVQKDGLQMGGLNWFTYWLRQEISNTIVDSTDISGPIDGNQEDPNEIEAGSISDVYKAQKMVEFYKMEVENKEKELAENQETLYGLEKAIERAEDNELDIIGQMREDAGETYKLYYVIIWLILIFQVILLLVLYYKRLFMIAVLVAVFPLVTVAYAYEKSKGGKSNVLQNWITEYTLNVFIQSVHAIIYVTLIEIGYSAYLASHDSWIIFLLSVFALITIEPVFRHILGLKGSTVSTLGDYSKMALGTVAAVGAVGSTIIHTKKDLKNISNDSKNKAAKAEKKDAEKDKRRETRGRIGQNLLHSNSRLGRAARFANKSKVLNKAGKIYGKVSSGARKVYRSSRDGMRKHITRARMAKRLLTNMGAAAGTIAGGLATGGTPDDFVKAAAVANAISGTNRSIELSDDAVAKQEEDKVSAENKIGDVSTETPENRRKPTYTGESYDDYSFDGDGSSNGGNQAEEQPKRNPVLKFAFTQKMQENKHMARKDRLDEQKSYKNWNITYEDDN